MEAKPDVWAIVPNFNGRHHLERCLPTLLATEGCRITILVIDDASTDDSVSFVRHRFPDVYVAPNEGRKGFAGASNTGIRQALAAGAQAIAVCNSDTRLHPQWLALSWPVLTAPGRTGLVGFVEVNPMHEEKFLSFDPGVGIEPARRVPGVPGCLMLFSSACLRNVGLFDEDFYLYGEDNDMFLRLGHAAWDIRQVCVPVWHHAGGSSPSGSLAISWLAYRNALRYALKNESPAGVLRMVAALGYFGMGPASTRLPGDAGYASFCRLRRQGRIVNAALLLASLAWNAANLNRTLRARRARTPPPEGIRA